MRRKSVRSAERSRRERNTDVTTFIECTPATRLTYVKASFAYLAFMTVWIYAFANTERHVPGAFILVALVAAMAVHFGAGFTMPRQETLALLAFPPLLALVGPGVNSVLWVPLLLMMVFPGAPLVLLGLWLRNYVEPREVDDHWF
jgi:uncharacterized membrane protein AbrB (regulator of aidB expression)